MKSFPSKMPNPAPQEMQFAKEVCDYLGCKDPLTRKFTLACFQAIKMFDFKQTQYGVSNIQDGGLEGIVYRLGDKVARLRNLLKKSIEPGEEGICDTAGDAGVYGIMGLMVEWGWWPGIAAREQVEVSPK